MELPDLKQFDRYWIENEHNDENGTDFADKKKISVIYALYVNETLVYIGMSVNFWRRFKEHRLSPKKSIFTSVAIQEFEHATRGELRSYEAIYINRYKPMWNKTGVF